jgi:transposase
MGVAMRGEDGICGKLFSYIDLEKRVWADHPLRVVREVANTALKSLTGEFAKLYSPIGRESIPPERLMRALLPQAFYSIRSERQLVERIDYDLLFGWFVGFGIEDPVWDATTFTKNRDRLLEGDMAARFLGAALSQDKVKGLLSSKHFSVEGTLLEAWASLKSFRPKSLPSGNDPGDGLGRARFRRERRRNDTPASTTRPPTPTPVSFAKACPPRNRKAGQRSAAVFHGPRADGEPQRSDCRRGDHARVGLCERLAALALIELDAERPPPVTLGADKATISANLSWSCATRR